jgi:diguanylate cyclase (GGDEF)-like protein/PAS domain S-box-containing protein
MRRPLPPGVAEGDRRRRVFDTLEHGVIVHDADGVVRDWNPAALRMLAMTADQLRGRTALGESVQLFWDNHHPVSETRHPVGTVLQHALQRDGMTIEVRDADSGSTWIAVSTHAFEDDDRDDAFVATLTDVSAQREAELQNARYREIIDTLHASHRILEESPIGMCSVDPDGNVLRSNMAFLGLAGADATSVLPLLPTDDRATLREGFARLMDGNTPSVRIETRFRRRMGGATWCEITAVAMRLGMPDAAILLLIEDVTERRRRETRLRQLAERDPLTGLHNRRSFAHILEQRLATIDRRFRRSGTGWTLLLIDLDGFKEVNDTCGHAGGDAVLIAVAGAIRDRTRVADSVGRLGGDEFAVLFESSDASHGIAIGEQIIERITEAARTVHGAPPVTASIGIVRVRSGRSAEETLAEADRAMYAAKRAGKSRVMAGT